MPIRILLLILLTFAVFGCAPSTPDSSIPREAARTASPPATLDPIAEADRWITAVPSPTPSSVPTPPEVTITASRGNLFIRRGPDLAFDPVDVLTKGTSEPALARDVLGQWLKIRIPNRPAETGWVSIQSQYSTVKGNVMSLPEMAPTDWPVLASIRNCTHDQMEAQPGGIIIPSLDNFPENDVQINPGIYRIYDVDVDGAPEVMKVEIREGSSVDIQNDGNGEHRKCPQP